MGIRLAARRSVEERNRLVEQWSGLPAHVWRRIRHRPSVRRLRPEDAVSAGMIGLIRAAELFDPSLGFKFSTYAFQAIQSQIYREARILSRDFSAEDLALDGLPAQEEEPAEPTEPEGWEDVRQLLRRLHPRDRMLIELYYLQGWTDRQIAAPMRISHQRVQQRRTEIIKRMRRMCGVHGCETVLPVQDGQATG